MRKYLIATLGLLFVGLAINVAVGRNDSGKVKAIAFDMPCGTAQLPEAGTLVNERVFVEAGADGRYLTPSGKLQGVVRISYNTNAEEHGEVVVPLAANPNTCADTRVKSHLTVAQSEALQTEKAVCLDLEQIAAGKASPQPKQGAPKITPEKAREVVDRMCRPYGLID